MHTFKIIAVLTGLVIAGEAAALLIGMHLLVRPTSPWLTPKNNALAVIDVISGVILVALTLTGNAPGLFYATAALALITHSFRDWEYLSSIKNPFVFNLPLFIINNLKLVGALAAIALKIRQVGL